MKLEEEKTQKDTGDNNDVDIVDSAASINLRQVSMTYNSQRASYKRQVSKLRKSYMEEQLQYQAQDLALQEQERVQQLRRRLERQRAKNERSAINAQRQEELRRQAHLAFQDHLRQQQQIRDTKKTLMKRAQQLLIDELEEEASLWMTTKEEVDDAFTNEAEQLLWGRPQGVIGVSNPSLDSQYWQYEGHTWDMSKTYQTQSDILLQEFVDQAYLDTNLDTDHVWTTERIAQQKALEQKAKLRALVRQEGRKSLLKRQKEFLQQDHITKDGEPPKPMPIPSLGILSNAKAQEKEGVDVLLKDPTKFFVFDNNKNNNQTMSFGQDGDDDDNDQYQGPTLGTPTRLKDPLRDPNGGRVFPIGIGKLPKADTRTEKEKKRQEREERLWAAAQQQKNKDDGGEDLDLIPEEDREIGEAIDYDNNDDWDSDDEEWEKGLDPELDNAIYNVPREFRYREQDIDFVISELEQKAASMASHVRNTVQTLEQEARSRMDRAAEQQEQQQKDGVDVTSEKLLDTTDVAADFATTSDTNEPFFDAMTARKLRQVGADVDKYEKLMSSFSQEQLLSLFALEAQQRKDNDQAQQGTATTETTTAAASSSMFESIPAITEEQVVGLTELESFMKILEKSTPPTVSNEIEVKN